MVLSVSVPMFKILLLILYTLIAQFFFKTWYEQCIIGGWPVLVLPVVNDISMVVLLISEGGYNTSDFRIGS
jgi:hypothetical protein